MSVSTFKCRFYSWVGTVLFVEVGVVLRWVVLMSIHLGVAHAALRPPATTTSVRGGLATGDQMVIGGGRTERKDGRDESHCIIRVPTRTVARTGGSEGTPTLLILFGGQRWVYSLAARLYGFETGDPGEDHLVCFIRRDRAAAFFVGARCFTPRHNLQHAAVTRVGYARCWCCSSPV